MDKGFIVHPTYEVVEGKAYVHLYGRLENGESFCIVNHARPYFYIKTADAPKAQSIIRATTEETDFRTFSDEPVTRVIMDNPKDVPAARGILQDKGISCYEADIRFAYRYMIDHNLKGAIGIKGKHEDGSSMHVDRIYRDAEVTPQQCEPSLRVLSIDIETDDRAQEVYCAALVMGGKKKIIISKKTSHEHAHSVTDEKQLLEETIATILSWDPDIITGWSVIDFDLRVLKERCKKYGIAFTLGRDNTPLSITLSESYFTASTAKCTGRMVLDGINLLKTSFIKLDDYKLNTAAQEFLGETKTITSDDRRAEIMRMYAKEPTKLAEYNLKDAELVLKILEKTRVLSLAVRRSMLTRMELDRVKASIASLDNLYIAKLREHKRVAPSTDYNEREERIIGGFVRDSKPGIYSNIIVCDFKSLYPSIMRTFNIDPLRFIPAERVAAYKKSDLITAPNGAHFLKKEGIMPQIIKELLEKREEAKKEKDELTSNAIKITMNSFFGVLANPQCRFYSLDMANAITHFGQHLIKLCAQKMQEEGHDVIYGDTDSIFVDAHSKDYDDAVKTGKRIAHAMNSFFADYVQKEYGRESHLELEFEKVYKKFLMPRIRGSEKGAKKRYAGTIEKGGKEEMEFVGLEFVRSDWTELAKKFQSELLEKVFENKEVMPFVRRYISALRAGKYDRLLTYRKAIRKGVDEYTKTTPPHVKAARKIGRVESGIIEYVMTTDGPEPTTAIKHPYDYEHYIEKQLRPVADAVLQFIDRTFDEALSGNSQSSLAGY